MVVDVTFKLSIFNLLYVDNEFILLKMVVDVLFKLFIDNIVDIAFEFKLFIDIVVFVEYEFKLLNIVVAVLFKLSIDNFVYVDNEFTFEFVANVEPLTFNDEIIVALYAMRLYELISYNPELFIL